MGWIHGSEEAGVAVSMVRLSLLLSREATAGLPLPLPLPSSVTSFQLQGNLLLPMFPPHLEACTEV